MKNHVRKFKDVLNEAKKSYTIKDVYKMMQDTNEWGDDAKDVVYMKKGNLYYIDSWFYEGDRRLKALEADWSPGGEYYEYWLDKLGVDIEIVDSFKELRAMGARHKRLTDTGIVGVVLQLRESKRIEEKKAVIVKTDDESLKDFVDDYGDEIARHYSGGKYHKMGGNGALMAIEDVMKGNNLEFEEWDEDDESPFDKVSSKMVW